MFLLIWVSILIAVTVIYLRQVYSRFSRYGIKHLKPVPFLGNMTRLLFRKDHYIDDVMRLYNSFPEEKFVGSFEFVTELLVIRDIELIKKINVKDFDHFTDHRFNLSTTDSYFSRNLLSLKGQIWRDMRSTLSPAFTGSKMRQMLPLMVSVGDQMISSLHKMIKNSESGFLDLDCKDLTKRYSIDVIACCCYGLNVDSYNDEDNKFYALGKGSNNFHCRQLFQSFVIGRAPILAKILKLDFLSERSKKFFKKLVLETMAERELKNIVRPDMLNQLKEAKKAWTDDDLFAQAAFFFIGVVDVTASSMSFFLYEMALNPDVQERLAQEIKETDAKNGGKLDLNSIETMPYMNMVVSEVLRLWPPGIAPDRKCTRDYNLGKPNEKAEKDYIVRKGTGISIPVFAIHRDPQYFPNPDKFDPERFSPENKHNIQPYTYFPFGVGPRSCIGTRFALCEMKLVAYRILQHMVISPCEKTTIPAKLDKETFPIRLEGGNWLNFRART